MKNLFKLIIGSKRNISIFLLIILEISLLTIAGISYGNKNLDKYIFGSSDLKSTNIFAIMIGDQDGNYTESTSNTFPGYEYFYNQEKSTCMDLSGKPIENSLLYNQDTKTASITISDTSSCYLYFDEWADENSMKGAFSTYLINSKELWQSGLEGDGYRYVGSGETGTETNPNNFICFGTSSQSECTSNPDKYMYRIIGVFPNSNGEQHVKLIKYKQLGSYSWSEKNGSNLNWGENSLYEGLNGNYFLTNIEYDYFQNETWLNKIEKWTWKSVNHQYSDISYNYTTPKGIYFNEILRKNSDGQCFNKSNNVTNCSFGSDTTIAGRIGLVYASDYVLSTGSKALSLTTGTNTNAALLKTGWLHQSNNDITKGSSEWIMSREGKDSDSCTIYFIDSYGDFSYNMPTTARGVRPVFYIKSNEKILKGNGNLKNPYVLSSTSLQVETSRNDSTLKANVIAGIGIIKKYCINTSSNINNCNWINYDNSTIIYQMPDYGVYYVHVIDNKGYIASASLNYQNSTDLNSYLINSGFLWQSGLEGDGYRYVGTGEYQCSYDSGNYIITGGANGCSGTVYDGDFNEVTLDSSGTKLSTAVSNYICFGTTDKTECLNNLDKYMYRIIGVFSDLNGEQHVKLIKFKQLNERKWNKEIPSDISWKDSDLYKGLNGDYFLENTAYDYLQNNTWLNKIMVWPWATVTQVINEGYDGASFEELSPKEFYSYELNKSNKVITVGNWASDNAKIGLMYASDYVLSLGSMALSLSTSVYDNRKLLSTGWMHQYNNDISIGIDESLMSSYKLDIEISDCESLDIFSDGSIGINEVIAKQPYRPVFYLNSDVSSSSGTGTLSDPYILKN